MAMASDVTPVPVAVAYGATPAMRSLAPTSGARPVPAAFCNDEEPRSRCSRLNKKGLPCGAAPIEGRDVCIGHSRQDVA